MITRDFFLVALSLLTWGIGESAFFNFQTLYLEQLGASPLMIGTLLGGVGIAMTIPHIPAGYLSDKLGRRKLLWASWGMGLVAGIIMALAQTLTAFAVGMILYGATAFVIAPLNSYITAARGKLSVARAITTISAAYNLGAIAGPLIGGYIAESYGLHANYIFGAITFTISTILILFIRKQPVTKTPTETSDKVKFPKAYFGLLVIVLVSIFAMYLPYPLTPNYLQNHKGVDLKSIGSLGAIGGLGNVILSLGLGSFSPAVGFILGQVGVVVFSISLWRGTSLPWFWLGYLFYGGYRAARGLIVALINRMVDEANMGLAYGINETIASLGVIIAPPVAGFLYDKNPQYLYIASTIVIIFSILLSYVYLSRGEKK